MEIVYENKKQLIKMIVDEYIMLPTYIAKQRAMEFLRISFRGLDFTTDKSLEALPYDELETMYKILRSVK